jgi:hypothetical protein
MIKRQFVQNLTEMTKPAGRAPRMPSTILAAPFCGSAALRELLPTFPPHFRHLTVHFSLCIRRLLASSTRHPLLNTQVFRDGNFSKVVSRNILRFQNTRKSARSFKSISTCVAPSLLQDPPVPTRKMRINENFRGVPKHLYTGVQEPFPGARRTPARQQQTQHTHHHLDPQACGPVLSTAAPPTTSRTTNTHPARIRK